MRSYHTTTFIVRILFFWIAAAAAIGQTDEEISRRRYEDKKILAQGDMSPLRRAFEEKNIKLLWAHTLGFDTSVMTREQNLVISAEAARYLSQIPGHTQNVIDDIERTDALTKNLFEPGTTKVIGLQKLAETEEELNAQLELEMLSRKTADPYFNQLEKLGSPECVQTLMTYLDDERRIGRHVGGTDAAVWRSDPNRQLAFRALWSVLGEQDPAALALAKKNSTSVDFGIQSLKDWWLSDASKKWRTPVVKTTRSHLLPGGSKGAETAPATAWALETFQRDALWPILLILCLAALAAILGFSKLRRS